MRMTAEEFHAWSQRLQFTSETEALIAAIRFHARSLSASRNGTVALPTRGVYAKPLGLSYRLRSSAEFHPPEIQNLKFLQDFWAHEVPPYPELEARALAHIQAHPGIPLT